MPIRKIVVIGTFLWVVLHAVGCRYKDESSIRGVSPDQARQLNGERSAFEASEDPPINAQTHFAAGQVSESHNDFARAVRQYDEALNVDPRHRLAMYRLGVCLSHLKKYAEAASVWQRYLDLTGGDAAAYSNLGFCYELAGQAQQAEEAYRKGIDRDPQNMPCRTNYGLMLARLGRTDEAMSQLRAVLSEAEAHYNLGSVLEIQGKKEGAKLEYIKALELDPNLNDAEVRLTSLR